jgi:hypothetical protein
VSAFGAQLEWLLRWLGLDVERLPHVPARVVRRQGDRRTRHLVGGACAGCLLVAVCLVVAAAR